MKYCTNEQLIEMIKSQEILSQKYNGKDWRKQVRLGWAKMALLDEVSEMATEIRPTWAWWKHNTTMDREKAVFEFVDVIHFAALIALLREDVETLVVQVEECDNDMGGPVGDPHNYFIKAITRFFRAVDEQNGLIVVGLMNIIETGAVLLSMLPGDVHKAYMMKSALNHERVEGGVMQGTYDKSNERELKL